VDQSRPRPPHGDKQFKRPNEVRRGIEHLLPLAKRFPHESDIAVFQIPQPAVNQPGGLGGRPAGQIVRLDEADRKPLVDQLAGDADAVDAAAEDEDGVRGELGHGAGFSAGTERTTGVYQILDRQARRRSSDDE
jgi:hypothetical protein